MQTGSYSAVAAWLTLRFHADPPVTRQQVYVWYTRGTLNAAGQPFPEPVREVPGALPTQPRLEFDVNQAITWAAAGVPGPHGSGWRQLGE